MKTNSLVGLVLYGVRGNDPGWLLIPPRPLDLVNPDKYIEPFPKTFYARPYTS